MVKRALTNAVLDGVNVRELSYRLLQQPQDRCRREVLTWMST